MKKTILFAFFILHCFFTYAQENADSLRQTARTLMQQGDLDNAIKVLDKAAELRPDDIDILKDQAYANYLRRDYSKAIEVSKKLIGRPDADVQSFQILGLTYKAIADYKEADKLYKTALEKFPNSAMLYSEYGELLASTDHAEEAIKQWEKGIETDPNISSNYYFASKYYAQKGDVLWALLYGETFVNIESLTQRTIEIKDILFQNYKKLFTENTLSDLQKRGTPFEKAVAGVYANLKDVISEDVTTEWLTVLRVRFILDWFDKYASQFPYRLFEHQRLMAQLGMLDAYDEWLFGASESTTNFQFWVHNHDEEMKDFQNYQKSVVYKIPAQQYYEH